MANTKEFAVVEFQDETIEIVPFYWLCKHNTKCFWPRKKVQNFQHLVSKNIPIRDTSHYTEHDIKVQKLSSKSFNLHF